MAFPTGWGRAQAITIDNTKVSGSGSHSNFPVLITLDMLDAEIVDAGSNSALNGGGDLRFSSDNAGTTQLAIEVVNFVTNATPGSRECEVWVKVPSISTSVDTIIYIWYKKAGESQPAVTDTYGRNAVWSDNEVVTHDGVTDSTGNYSITNTSTSLTTGPFGGDARAKTDVTSGSQYITVNLSGTIDVPFTLQGWSYIETQDEVRITTVGDASVANQQAAVGAYFLTGFDVGALAQAFGGTAVQAETSDGQTEDIWQMYSGVYTSDTLRDIYLNDGASTGTDTTTIDITGIDRFRMGASADSTPFGKGPMRFAEGRLRLSALSVDWIATEYNNQDAPSTFASAGTPFTPGAPAGALSQLALLGVG